ncbi:MAG: aminotransferase class V-fold PLP-dependent enzyme [Nocardioidaceae bacterium]
MRDAFDLDPTVAHLNHGSFGTVPRVVAEAQRRVRDRAEANPQRFFRVESPGLKVQAREVAAAALGVGADEVGLVRNVTASIATVLSSLAWQGRLGPRDVVLLNEQSYGAVSRTVAHWCDRTGASYDVVPLPVAATAEQVVAAHREAIDRIEARGERPRLLVVDQISSPTGSVQPTAEVAALAHRTGALVFVDGAHAPGHVPTDPAATGADFWTGTWHKWGFAPRGTSALWVAEDERDAVVPLTTSWNHGTAFPLPFDTHGTDDYSGWYALETAVQFWREAGGYGIGARGSALLEDALPMLVEAVRASRLEASPARLPADPAPCLRLLALPDGVADTEVRAGALYEALSEQHVETQVVAFGGRGWIRLSGAVYNAPEDYQRLAEVLPGTLRAQR